MAKKRTAQRFLEALKPRTEGQRMRAPAVRGTMEYSLGQLKGAGVGAGAGAAAGAGGAYLAMRDDDEDNKRMRNALATAKSGRADDDDDDEDNKRMRNALATAKSGRADDDLEEGYPSVSQRRAARGAAMAEGLPEDGEVESGAAVGGRSRSAARGSYDNMSFNAAFKAARGDDRSTFTWRGKSYTTEVASPKAAMAMSEPAPKKATQYDDEEPAKMRKGGSVKMSRAGKMPPLSKLGPPKMGPTPKGIARFAKGGEVKGAGAARYGMRGCKKY